MPTVTSAAYSPTPSDISSIRFTPQNIPASSVGGSISGNPYTPQSSSSDRYFLEPLGVPLKHELNHGVSTSLSRTLPSLTPQGSRGPASIAGSDICDQLIPPSSALSQYASSFNSLSPFPIEISPAGSSFASPRHSARSLSARGRKRALSLSPLSADGLDFNSIIRTSPTSLVAYINGSRGSSTSMSPCLGLHSGEYGHLSARSGISPLVHHGIETISSCSLAVRSLASDISTLSQQKHTYTCSNNNNANQMPHGGMPQSHSDVAGGAVSSQLVVQPRNEALLEYANFHANFQPYKQESNVAYPVPPTNSQYPHESANYGAHVAQGIPFNQDNPTAAIITTYQDVPYQHQNLSYTNSSNYSSQQNNGSYPPSCGINYHVPGGYSNQTAPFTSNAIGHVNMQMSSLSAELPPPPPYSQHFDSARSKPSPPLTHVQGTPSPVKHSDENEEKILICRWIDCNGIFDEQEELVRHIEKVHIDQRKGEDFTCFWQGCTRRFKPFNARYKLLIHMRVHSGEKPNKCTVSKASFR